VERQEFKDVMAEIHPSYQGPGRRQLPDLVLQQNIRQKNVLQEDLATQARRPACVLDLWCDRRGRHYIGVAASFIDSDWKLRVVNLGLRSFEGRHTGENIKVPSTIDVPHVRKQ